MTSTQTSYAPRTRAGLLISCIGFGTLAATSVVPALAAAVSPMIGIGFVAAVLVIVYVPRLIRVGPTWSRSALPKTFATVVFSTSGIAALAAVTVSLSSDTIVSSYVAMAVIVGEIVGVAVATPERQSSTRHNS